MYKCKECDAPATATEEGVTRTCSHETTIVMDMEATANGTSRMNATTTNNNLTEQSQVLTKAYLQMLVLQEFMSEDKKTIYVNDQKIVDAKTGRTFVLSITGEEI